MTEKQEQVAADICRGVTARYPHAVAGYRDFISPALRPEPDEPITLHVLCLEHIEYDEIYDYVQSLAITAACEHDVHIAFAVWNFKQVAEYFMADAERLAGVHAALVTCSVNVRKRGPDIADDTESQRSPARFVPNPEGQRHWQWAQGSGVLDCPYSYGRAA